MKTLSFKNLFKYALLTVTLITAFFAALFIFTPKLRASAEETSTTTTSTGFIHNGIGCYNNNGLTFQVLLSLQKSSELHNTITGGRIITNEMYDWYSEYYIVTVVTDNIQSYNDVNNFSATKTTDVSTSNFTKINNIELYDLLFTSNGATAERFIAATPTANDLTTSNTLNAEKNYTFDDFTTSDIDFNVNKSTSIKYVYSFIIEYNHTTSTVGSDYNPKTRHNETINVIAKTENYLEFSPQELVENRLKNATTKNDELFIACQTYLGIYTSGEATVNVNYITMKDYSLYENANITFNIDSVYATSPKIIETELFKVLASSGFDDITDFNAKYVDYKYVADGSQNFLGEKIIRQATSLDVQTDFTQIETVNVNVVYSDFNYSDLALYVSNNGYNIDTELLEMAIHTTDVQYDSVNNRYTLTFNYALIKQQLKNTCNWLFNLESSNIKVKGSNSHINVTVNNDALIVSFYGYNEEYLFGLSLKAVVKIIEDYDFTYTFKYVKLDNDLNETWLTSTPYTLKYSKYVDLINDNNFYLTHEDVIDEAISPSVLNGIKFYKYNNIKESSDKESATALITVEYAYTTMFKLISSTGEIYYVPLTKNSLNYTFSELGFDVPPGYRVKDVSHNSNDVNIVYSEDNAADAKITVNIQNNLKHLITLNVDITDTWIVKINHLTRYKQTPFAEYLTTEKEVKVADYERSVYQWTKDDVAKVLGVSTLNVLSSAPDLITVTFDKISTYTIDVTYSKASITQIDYDGNRCEIQVPLTSYADWTNFYGKDWSILFLNNQDERYFKYANEVPRDKLYGYFAVAVFKEQVKDFNYYFKNNTGDGCMAFYNSSEVVGSDLYKFFGGLRDSVLGLYAHVGMALCEIVNDSNAIYHSYFFFLNSDSDLPFISNGGADNAFDDDGAFGNAVEDTGDALANFATSIGEFFSSIGGFFETLGVVLIAVLIIGAVVVVIYLIKK